MTTSLANILTIDSVLYVIPSSKIEYFHSLAEPISNTYEHLIPQTIEKTAFYVTLFNIWLTIQKNESPIYIDETKRLNHPLPCFVLEQIIQHTHATHYIDTNKLNAEELFIVSFWLTIEIEKWFSETVQHIEDCQLSISFNNVHTANMMEQLKVETTCLKALIINIREKNTLTFSITHAITLAAKDIIQQRSQL